MELAGLECGSPPSWLESRGRAGAREAGGGPQALATPLLAYLRYFVLPVSLSQLPGGGQIHQLLSPYQAH